MQHNQHNPLGYGYDISRTVGQTENGINAVTGGINFNQPFSQHISSIQEMPGEQHRFTNLKNIGLGGCPNLGLRGQHPHQHTQIFESSNLGRPPPPGQQIPPGRRYQVLDNNYNATASLPDVERSEFSNVVPISQNFGSSLPVHADDTNGFVTLNTIPTATIPPERSIPSMSQFLTLRDGEIEKNIQLEKKPLLLSSIILEQESVFDEFCRNVRAESSRLESSRSASAFPNSLTEFQQADFSIGPDSSKHSSFVDQSSACSTATS